MTDSNTPVREIITLDNSFFFQHSPSRYPTDPKPAPGTAINLTLLRAFHNPASPPPWCASLCQPCRMPASCRVTWRIIKRDRTDRRAYLRDIRAGARPLPMAS